MTRNINPGPLTRGINALKYGRRMNHEASSSMRSNYVSQCKNCGYGVFSNMDTWSWQTGPVPGIIHARCAL